MGDHDDYLKLINENLKDIKEDLKDHRKESHDRHNELTAVVDKQDVRLRTVEASQSKFKGALAVLSFIGLSGIATLFKGN